MKILLTGIALLLMLASCQQPPENAFWHDGNPVYEQQPVFDDQRFPNILVTQKGTVLANWGGISQHHGEGSFLVRRSEDGGSTWGPLQTITKPVRWNGGGSLVDETSGDILLFVEKDPMTVEFPAGPLHIFRSSDDGLTWQEQEYEILPNSLGHIPSMHINERGLTLQYGPHAGRLIRASRYYGQSNEREHWEQHYTNAMYSDDGGYTWQTSEPFPAYGTGEAAIEELSDGTLYYNSRRHLSTDGLDPLMRHIAYSYDGGHTWTDLSVSDVLPDGPSNTTYGLMAGLVRLPVEGHDILIFSNVESDSGRHSGTIWASFDGGQTWPVKQLAEEGGFAYSSLAAGRAGTPSEGFIYLLYEDAGHPDSKGIVARFNLDWVTGGRDWTEFLP